MSKQPKPKAQRKDAAPKNLPEKRPVGRPPFKWTEELMQDICDHLTTGKSLLDIANLQGYPSSDSMYRQMAVDPDFAARIARAREAGQDHEADACVHMADMATSEDWQVVKLRISARQWRAAKLAPKRYGERQQVEASVSVRKESPIDWSALGEDAELVEEAIRRTLARQIEAKTVEDDDD